MSRTQHPGGWVATFIIVGAVLVIGLAGSIYYLKNHDKTSSDQSNGPITVPESTTDTSNNQDTAKDDQSKDTAVSTDNDTKTSSDDQSSSTDESKDLSTSNSSTGDDSKKGEVNELPTTGPTETVASFMAAGLLTFSGVSYVSSRRHSRTLQ